MNNYTRIDIIDALLKVCHIITFPYKVLNKEDLINEIKRNKRISYSKVLNELKGSCND